MSDDDLNERCDDEYCPICGPIVTDKHHDIYDGYYGYLTEDE